MEDVKFIVMFTACFVIVSCIILGGGYAIIKVTGILEPGTDTSTVTPVPSHVPEGPTEIPLPTAPIIIPATPTPVPTPVPTSYSVNVNYNGDASSRVYTLSYTLKSGSSPIDMDLAMFSVWEPGIVFQNATYSQAKTNGAKWSGADGDSMLETGETFVFQFSDYALNIQPDTEPHVTFIVAGEVIKTTTLPVLINPDLSNLDPADPEATLPPFG